MTNAPTKIVPAEAFGTSEHCWLPIEDGVDPLFVQQQVGHSWASTTAVYTSVGTDAKNRMLAAALARAFATDATAAGTTAAGTTQ